MLDAGSLVDLITHSHLTRPRLEKSAPCALWLLLSLPCFTRHKVQVKAFSNSLARLPTCLHEPLVKFATHFSTHVHWETSQVPHRPSVASNQHVQTLKKLAFGAR